MRARRRTEAGEACKHSLASICSARSPPSLSPSALPHLHPPPLSLPSCLLSWCCPCCRAIESGSILLLEDLGDEVDDMVEQVLQQETFHDQHGQLCIKLGAASALLHPRCAWAREGGSSRDPSHFLRLKRAGTGPGAGAGAGAGAGGRGRGGACWSAVQRSVLAWGACGTGIIWARPPPS